VLGRREVHEPLGTVNRPDSTWTTRDIAAGEELTTDYREFDLPSRDRMGKLYVECGDSSPLS
jgi:hypothetical protein